MSEIIELKISPYDKVAEGLTPFNLRWEKDEKALCCGVFSEGKIWIHLIEGTMKPFLNYLVGKFGTDRVVFTPIITSSLPSVLKGFEIKTLSPTHPDNPYGEEMQYMEGTWRRS